MSLSRTRLYKSLESLEVQLTETISAVNGFSHRDSHSVAMAGILWLLSMNDIAGTPDIAITTRFEWLVQLFGSKVSEIASILKDFATQLRRYDVEIRSEPLSVRGFKRLVHDRIGLSDPIKSVLLDYLTRGSSLSLSRLLTYCEFWTRIPIGDSSLDSRCISEFLEVNETIGKVPIPDFIETMKSSYASRKLFVIDDVSPVDFSGNASSNVPRYVGVHQRRSSAGLPVSKGRRLALMLDIADQFGIAKSIRPAKLRVVPKNVLTRRIISTEPTTLMALQKYIKDPLYRWLRSEFKINLFDQSRNQRFAEVASRTRDYATIDLSAASDRVPNNLVKELLRHTPLYFYTQYARSTHVQVGRTIVPLNMHAPMGSALCFPIETLVFATIIEAAGEAIGRRRPYGVYGDDLVVHKDIYDKVVEYLTRCGFVVNQSKTFEPSHPYKESCGAEYSNGCGLDIFRLSRQFFWSPETIRSSPNEYTSIIETCNRLKSFGFKEARGYLLRKLLDEVPSVPFTRIPDNFGILTDTQGPINFNLKLDKSASERFQAPFAKAMAPVTRRSGLSSEIGAASTWLIQAERRRPENFLQIVDDVGGSMRPTRPANAVITVPAER